MSVSQDALVQFMSVMAIEDTATAEYYLQASGNDLEKAI